VCRRFFGASFASCGRSGEKGGAQEPRDHALGCSRGGFGSKFRWQVHESTQFEAVMDIVRVPQTAGRPRTRPERLAGDKGYSYPRIRNWLRRHAIKPVMPQRSDQLARHKGRPLSFDRQAYRQRSTIENCIGWLKECRRVATRFEKLALNHLAMIKMAIIQRYLRIAFSDRA